MMNLLLEITMAQDRKRKAYEIIATRAEGGKLYPLPSNARFRCFVDILNKYTAFHTHTFLFAIFVTLPFIHLSHVEGRSLDTFSFRHAATTALGRFCRF